MKSTVVVKIVQLLIMRDYDNKLAKDCDQGQKVCP